VAEVAFYSIVRYIEDLDRQEPLNVGVLVASSVGVHRRFVEREVEERDVVQRFGELIEHLVQEHARIGTEASSDFLRDLAQRRFSHFDITEPRQIRVDDNPDATAERVARSLADAPASAYI
jgi:hypothetical protein